MYDLHPKVEEFKLKKTKWSTQLETLRELFLAAGLKEDFKWNQPCYTLDGKNVASIGVFKEYIGAMFFKGALIDDPKSLLLAHGDDSQAMRSVRFYEGDSVDPLIDDLNQFVKVAILNESAGKKVLKTKQELVFPEELLKMFREDEDFEQAFKALTPGRQRAYNIFFTGAKQSETMIRRIEKYYDKILEGQGMND